MVNKDKDKDKDKGYYGLSFFEWLIYKNATEYYINNILAENEKIILYKENGRI